jgi:hypothetical protein
MRLHIFFLFYRQFTKPLPLILFPNTIAFVGPSLFQAFGQVKLLPTTYREHAVTASSEKELRHIESKGSFTKRGHGHWQVHRLKRNTLLLCCKGFKNDRIFKEP